MNTNLLFVDSLTKYKRRITNTVKIGDLLMGSEYPIRIQSMTTTDTMDTLGSVNQIIRMVDAGCELVRLTAPSINEAENLANIKKELQKRGVHIPLVADIHFTPNAAEMAARIVEKVRVNPGNYADKKKFQVLEYTDVEYDAEIARIREKFLPLLAICKEYGTALRIGTNHGSLSDRILSRYGDTPIGMVESAMEFLRIAEDENFHNIVLSMKASNPQVMVQAYRLLVQTMNQNNMHYPLHLGVTEAGDGDDGRIKSALGIGALLEDGIGDTIRVSLTEDPEFEVPVAKKLAKRYVGRENNTAIPNESVWMKGQAQRFYSYEKRVTQEVYNFGGNHVPRVLANFSFGPTQMQDLAAIGYTYEPITDKWSMSDVGADYIYFGSEKPEFMLPMGLKAIYNAADWQVLSNKDNSFPLFKAEEFLDAFVFSSTLNFVRATTLEFSEAKFLVKLGSTKNVVLILEPSHPNAMCDLRNSLGLLAEHNLSLPIVFGLSYPAEENPQESLETTMLFSSTDSGSLLIDGFGNGIFFTNSQESPKRLNDISFGILQAARTRISKTEYISCPSCGRTLFDLQETTAMIRKRTDHLKGIKIAIMGCIVNGPGEMADAHYGYVGSGPGKITLYKGKEVVKKAINSENAVDLLIDLIKENGDWIEN
ncbi:MAG: 4-hydroxy-3-methylbut-2-en-1-yl diphosphate synthase [Bacteroidetes bacterium B1(2017)]|nr:MAG: 4-hydroxy-3-methylbut-2-en-1-yl diphosphate synthase [Bacteroidetes bacterium B1(2017)]